LPPEQHSDGAEVHNGADQRERGEQRFGTQARERRNGRRKHPKANQQRNRQ
jgi:hypothetical protein